MMTTVNKNKHLFGAIIGDIVGSVYEFSRQKSYDFDFFSYGCNITDDTILTCATAEAILRNGNIVDTQDFANEYYDFAKEFPHPMGGYGAGFSTWVFDGTMRPYNSLGNGAPMRVSPCAYFSAYINRCLEVATMSASATHNHWQAIRAVQCVTFAIYELRHGTSVKDLLAELDQQFGYKKVSFYVKHPDLFDAYRNDYEYTEHAETTVIGALICALSATSFEDAIRRAVSLGGDADTLAAIAGSIAEARFEIPDAMIDVAKQKLPKKLLDIVTEFNETIAL